MSLVHGKKTWNNADEAGDYAFCFIDVSQLLRAALLQAELPSEIVQFLDLPSDIDLKHSLESLSKFHFIFTVNALSSSFSLSSKTVNFSIEKHLTFKTCDHSFAAESCSVPERVMAHRVGTVLKLVAGCLDVIQELQNLHHDRHSWGQIYLQKLFGNIPQWCIPNTKYGLEYAKFPQSLQEPKNMAVFIRENVGNSIDMRDDARLKVIDVYKPVTLEV
ncbi:hypothetical protein BX600DRAFT_500709 [Xylariales sp. PMI_506]|nr:hypothetical protein BX600DRAFT_500709 [Xylariales sp. PMI_506]